MNKSATIHARIEPTVKQKAENVLKKLGLSPTDAIRLFYKQICLQKGIPFEIKMPNSTTAKTLNESKNNKNVIKSKSLNEMFDSWEK